MKKNNRVFIVTFVVMIIVVLSITILIVLKNNNNYNIEKKIVEYNINNDEKKNTYLNFLKEEIKPIGLDKFIDNDFIYLDDYNTNANGHSVIRDMKVDGYLNLFNSLFDKERINFDDCPVTDNFKEKFKENLLKHFSLIEGEDCVSVCMFDYDEKTLEVTVYSNFENTEPINSNTHHFHYTLDSDGNVDDVVFDYTEE